MTTRATDKPLKRVVKTRYAGELILEVTEEKMVLRPPRTRKGGPAEVTLTWGAMYDRLLRARVE